MATAVGEAVIKLSFDGKNLSASLANEQKEVEKHTSKMGSALGKVGSVAKTAGKAIGASFLAGTAAASGAVVAIGKSALSAYADYEQLAGGVETLFGEDVAKTISGYADKAYQTAGLSANEYMEQATSFSARLIQGLGGDTAKAAEYANQAIVDMSDNANKMGTDIGMIQSAYQGFAKQNYTMLDNLKLGYGGTASEMARLVNDSGVMGKSFKATAKNINDVSFDKIIEAIHKTQERLKITGTTSKEASTTISGSVNMMKKSWQNLLTGIASDDVDFGKLVDNFVNGLTTMFQQIGPRIGQIAQGIAQLVEKLAPILAQMIPTFVQTLLPPIVQAIIQLAIAIIPMIPQILKIIIDALVQNLPLIIDGLMQLIPLLIGMIPDFIGAVLQIFGAVIGALLPEIMNWVGQLGKWLGDTFSGIWNGLCNGAKGAWEGIKRIFGSVASFFGSVFSNAWNAVKAVFSTGGRIFGGIVEGITRVFKSVVNGIIGGINNVVAVPFNAINGALNRLRGINIAGMSPFGWLPSIGVPRIPLLAQGGYANGATGAVIGEAGKEVVLPLERNTDNWAGLLASTLAKQMEEEGNSGRSIVVNMTNQINNEMDAEDIGRKLMQSIRRAS